ncbi:hypothetical protein GLOTRDRAFT_140767 [Gloeophyllum trabeum ATCC 11539]|uniref:SAP domain-containing protein n=1 Tax=Gloeophyllum trabeum (strain ATCC 11539 / FP-39264 / Madison 617) TaxID=670483 RepID=S7PVV8_GLOTA|nr:uncharacterized protein GLOTRDRAFT_140767 [Gloeophyllum trabeum ATCC 11539]EPQ51766.1 hypothetical protein GLOTRDRAFT_140767 [Gloeophyllum trabeum ATCC 11539]
MAGLTLLCVADSAKLGRISKGARVARDRGSQRVGVRSPQVQLEPNASPAEAEPGSLCIFHDLTTSRPAMSTSTTATQILFNSPALHALRRDQLLSLCRRHGLRAQGRNDELIQRLKRHAQALYAEPAGDHDARNEHDEDDDEDEDEDMNVNAKTNMNPRQSEQWEMMDTIEEMEEGASRQGSLNSLKSARGGAAGEFGTGSSKSSSVSSSIRALASSFGLKRASSKKRALSTSSSPKFPAPASPSASLPALVPVPEPTKSSAPSPVQPLQPQPLHATHQQFSYSTPPPSPPTAHTELGGEGEDADKSLSAPVPGHEHRPGRPAPFDAARLSMGAGADATTIRLITTAYTRAAPSPPKLAPLATAFDLLPASPGVARWPASPEKPGGGIYPALPFAALGAPRFDMPGEEDVEMDMSVDMPGGFGGTPACHSSQGLSATPSITTTTNTTTTHQPNFTTMPAPADVRSPRPSEPFIFGSPSPKHRVSNAQFQAAAASVLEEMNRRLGLAGEHAVGLEILEHRRGGAADRTAPEEQGSPGKFKIKEKFDEVHQREFEKMPSIASYAARHAGRKRKSAAMEERRPAPAPASKARVISVGNRKKVQAEAASSEDEGERRSSKRPRMAEEVKEVAGNTSAAAQKEEKEAQKDKEKEREAIKRRLAINKAKRRSSRGRPSIGVAKPPVKPAPKASTSRFGFFSSAKSIVKNVWNKGAGIASGSKNATSLPAKPAAAPSATTSSKTAIPRPASVASKAAPPSVSSNAGSASRFSSAKSDRTSSTLSSNAGGSSKPASARPRPPIPTFSVAPVNSNSASRPRAGSTASAATNAGPYKRPSTLPTAPDKGHKRTNSGSSVSSMGTRTNATGKAPASTGAKRSSTLLAPTASSLAKQNSARHSAASSLSSIPARKPSGPLEQSAKANQGALANRGKVAKPSPTKLLLSPKNTKIFSKPLAPVDGSLLPTPVRDPSGNLAGSSSSTVAASNKGTGFIPRKPRLSRSRVITKLGSQRPVVNPTRKRSSIGVAASRRSLGGVKAGKGIMLSAKKKARQSEFAMRKSKVSNVNAHAAGADAARIPGSMDVEA